MTFTMPDVRNLSEVDAQAALAGLGLDAAHAVNLYPSVISGVSDDHDELGHRVGFGQNADTVGADGTISWQRPAAGETITVTGPTVGGTYLLSWTDSTSGHVFEGLPFEFDVWGVVGGDLASDELITTLGEWAQSPETTAYQDTGPLTTGAWTWADWEAGSSFRIELWTLHKPTTPAALIGEITQFADPNVKESLCDQTEFSVTISMEDPLLDTWQIGAYTQAAKVFYRNQIKPIYFAPVTYTDRYGENEGKIDVRGINVRRLQKHNLRRGDDAINKPDDEGVIRLDGDGYAMLLQAAQNTDAQDTADYPSLGIQLDDHGTAQADIVVGVERGDNVWDTALEVANNVLGRDFELDPQPDTDGVYMLMRIWNKRGSNRTATVRFYYHVTDTADNPDLVDNVVKATVSPIDPITHVHALDRDRRYRITRADPVSAALRGPYVEWIQSNLKVRKKPSTKKPDLDALTALAQATVDAYSNGSLDVDLELRPDAGQTAFYREQYWPGDTVWAQGHDGDRVFEGNFRIRDVTVGESGPRGMTVTKLSLAPDLALDPDPEDA